MEYRRLGKTNLMVSEIGFGGEWLERHSQEECYELLKYAKKQGINILDCWMSNPTVRSNIGYAIKDDRASWYIQGHIGSTWEDGQYVRTRDVKKVDIAFKDLLNRLQTDYIDLGMIHYVDQNKDYEEVIKGPFYDYILNLKKLGIIKHIGMSTHNPAIAKRAVLDGLVEMILFSINPAFDLLPAVENLDEYFANDYDHKFKGISLERQELYQLCETHDVGITVMKGYMGGRLFNKDASPFKVALSPIQCIHYALTRPAVASIMIGYDTISHIDEAISYLTSTEEAKDYATVLAKAPYHAFLGECTYCGHCKPCPKDIDIAMVNKLYDLATLEKGVTSSLYEHYQNLSTNASDCIGCHSCETRCPFQVKIAERMKKASILFNEYHHE